MPNNIIGIRLQELRDLRGMSQEAVSEASGVARISLARYETGTRAPRMDNAVKLAQFYGVSTDYILGIDTADKKIDLPTEQEIDDAIAASSAGLTPDEVQRVVDFIAGLKAARRP